MNGAAADTCTVVMPFWRKAVPAGSWATKFSPTGNCCFLSGAKEQNACCFTGKVFSTERHPDGNSGKNFPGSRCFNFRNIFKTGKLWKSPFPKMPKGIFPGFMRWHVFPEEQFRNILHGKGSRINSFPVEKYFFCVTLSSVKTDSSTT